MMVIAFVPLDGCQSVPVSEDAMADLVTADTMATIARVDAAGSDGGPAPEANLDWPSALAVAAQGKV